MHSYNTSTKNNFVSIAEAIIQVPYTREYLIKLARAGRIKSKQVDRQWLLDSDSLLCFFESNQLEDAVKKRILSQVRKNDIDSKINYQKKVSSINARVHHYHLASLFLSIIVIGGGLISGVSLSFFASNYNSTDVPIANMASAAMSAFSLEGSAISQTANFYFTENQTLVEDSNLDMQTGIVLLPAYDSTSKDVADFFSDPVTIEQNGVNGGFVYSEEAKMPFVRVPETSSLSTH